MTSSRALRQAWTRDAAGDRRPRRAACSIRGDAGLGKSRLVVALADEVRRGGHRVVELHGSPFHADVGLHPVRDLIEARCGIRDDSPATTPRVPRRS